MGAAPLSWLAKIGGDTLKTKAKLLSSAINELYDDGFKKRDIVGLDYIKAATADDLKNKVPEANAVKVLNSNLDNKANSSHTHDDRYYTETEVNNTVSTINGNLNNLSNTVSTINGNLNNLSNTVSNLNNNMNVRYVPSTDMVQIYYNGSWHNWASGNLQAYYLFRSGVGFTNGIAANIVEPYGTLTYSTGNIYVAGTSYAIMAFSLNCSQFRGSGKSLYLDFQFSNSLTGGSEDFLGFSSSLTSDTSVNKQIISGIAPNTRTTISISINNYCTGSYLYPMISLKSNNIAIFNAYIK